MQDTNFAPCGPECRFASAPSNGSDFLWCARLGAPRRSGGKIDCRYFSPRSSPGTAGARQQSQKVDGLWGAGPVWRAGAGWIAGRGEGEQQTKQLFFSRKILTSLCINLLPDYVSLANWVERDVW